MQLTALPGGQRAATPNPKRDLTALSPEQSRQWREAIIERRIATAGFPHQLASEADWSFRGLRPKWQADGLTDPVAVAREWAGQNPPRGFLVMHGPVGCGKSILGVLAAMLAAQQSRVDRLMYTTCLGLLGQWSNLGKDESVDDAPWSVDLLVLDELKAPSGVYPSVINQLVDLVNVRWQRGLATIVTANLADDEAIARVYGRDILSRLMDVKHNAALLWSPDAPDWRAVL